MSELPRRSIHLAHRLAIHALNIPSVSLALIDRDRVALARAYGAGATPEVVMTNSDNGSILVEALIRRAAVAHGWPPLGALAD
jgi:hypothetical protein